MYPKVILPVALGLLTFAQKPATNYDERKVPAYTLPDPLATTAGKRVTTAREWERVRRPEILRLFEENMFGRSPGRPPGMTFEPLSIRRGALNETAVRKEIAVYLNGKKDGPRMDILLYLPASAKSKVPVFLGLNFAGNHAVTNEPDVRLSTRWMRGGKGVVDHRATDESRGEASSRWDLANIIGHGYGLATAYYGDLEPDRADGRADGVRAVFQPPTGDPGSEWGAIAAWAWGLSRALDYLETDPNVDAKKVIVMGHSRLGKTALWAGASDRRFAAVISNDSGEGGAAISRRNFGENVADLNRAFPHWFCANYKKYSDNVNALPVDSHMLIALIAPRPVYIASAVEDTWADPKGEFLGGLNADPVYRLLGTDGLGTKEMPGIEKPVMTTIGYHIRNGKHDVTAYDWAQYLAWADRHVR
jgi:hypothetical protein